MPKLDRTIRIPDVQGGTSSRSRFLQTLCLRVADVQASLLPKLGPSLASPWLSTMFVVAVLFRFCTPACLAELLGLRCAVLMERALRN